MITVIILGITLIVLAYAFFRTDWIQTQIMASTMKSAEYDSRTVTCPKCQKENKRVRGTNYCSNCHCSY
ncbi:hypothetical protein GCM10007380_15120 [Gottfriedia solisilvae]|uniref:Uncharacterized protein n=1 Tax=Gottfriedia solisilvae TaxID=1516104 RepID=A0A8J3AHE5_9BACI|nr:hypothetical protein GCM10007380_15120 [Gottfriedia solisilvae]